MMFKYRGITLGCDPELFLKDKKSGDFFPVCGLLGGTKDRPKRIDRKGHAVQEDNVMVEFNIPPAHNLKQWQYSIDRVLQYVAGALPQFELSVVASATFRPEHLQSAQALTAGCDPDYNAWTIRINQPPDIQRTTLRTAGGHIHVGYKNPDIDNQLALIKAMDLFIGVPSVVLDPDRARRALYGAAGAFRPKDYGVEYRGASNFWVASSKLQEWVFNNTHRAIQWLNGGGYINKMLSLNIQNTINSGDKDKATEICNKFNLLEGV